MTDTEGTSDRYRRFWALSAEAHRIGAQPNPGRPEVERLAEIVEEMQAFVDDLPEERARRARSQYHQGRVRAVDWRPPLPSLLQRWADHRS